MAGDEERPSSEPLNPGALDSEPPAIRDAAEPITGQASRPDSPFGVHAGHEPREADQPARPSSLPTVAVVVVGAIVILLLLANLYALYNPRGNDALASAVADIDALKQRVATMESKPDASAALDSRLAGLTGAVEAAKAEAARGSEAAGQAKATADDAKAAVTPLDAKIADLGKGALALQAAIAALPKIDLGPLDAKTASLDEKIGGLDKRVVPLEAYFQAPKAGVQVTEARQNGSAAETRAAPLAVIAQGVLAAIEAGRPFETEVEALTTLGADPAALAALQPVAAKGAATRADLAAGFGTVQDTVVVAAAPVETGTVFDRILANAQGMVKVNRTGAAAGADAAAISSRIADDLKRGDLVAAAAEWDTLPAASKTRSADWAGRLKARINAEDAARSIETKAVAALAAAQ